MDADWYVAEYMIRDRLAAAAARAAVAAMHRPSSDRRRGSHGVWRRFIDLARSRTAWARRLVLGISAVPRSGTHVTKRS